MATTEIKNKANNIEELIKLLNGKQVTGYIWMVEDKQPYVYKNKEVHFDKLNKTGSPYNKIQEAYLKDKTHSIHIKNIDGEEKVFVFTYQYFNGDNFSVEEEKKYPSHLNSIENLHFKQVYQLTDNEISKGFNALQPVVKLFTGLTPKTN